MSPLKLCMAGVLMATPLMFTGCGTAAPDAIGQDASEFWGAIDYAREFTMIDGIRATTKLTPYIITDAPTEEEAQRQAKSWCTTDSGTPCSTSGYDVYAFSTDSDDPGAEGAPKVGRCAAIVWGDPPGRGSDVRGTGVGYVAYAVGSTKAAAEAAAEAYAKSVGLPEYSSVAGSSCNTR